MPTAQQLVDMSSELTNVVKSINVVVGKQSLPYDADTMKLVNTASTLASHANSIGQAGLAALSADVQGAIADLTTQVKAANSALQRIDNVKKALDIVGVLLTGAAKVASSAATGNWIGVAGDIATVASSLKTEISATQTAASAGGGH